MQATAYVRVLMHKLVDFLYHGGSQGAPERIQVTDTEDHMVRIPPSTWWYDIYTQWTVFFWSPASLIVEGLWLGGALNAQDYGFMERENIKAVVNLSQEVPDLHLPHVTYCRCSVRDQKGCQLPLRGLAGFIHAQRQAGRPVLVHCFIGRSRSVAAVCAYLMVHMGYSFQQAYAHVSRARPAACLNADLVRQLQQIQPWNPTRMIQAPRAALPPAAER